MRVLLVGGPLDGRTWNVPDGCSDIRIPVMHVMDESWKPVGPAEVPSLEEMVVGDDRVAYKACPLMTVNRRFNIWIPADWTPEDMIGALVKMYHDVCPEERERLCIDQMCVRGWMNTISERRR